MNEASRSGYKWVHEDTYMYIVGDSAYGGVTSTMYVHITMYYLSVYFIYGCLCLQPSAFMFELNVVRSSFFGLGTPTWTCMNMITYYVVGTCRYECDDDDDDDHDDEHE